MYSKNKDVKLMACYSDGYINEKFEDVEWVNCYNESYSIDDFESNVVNFADIHVVNGRIVKHRFMNTSVVKDLDNSSMERLIKAEKLLSENLLVVDDNSIEFYTKDKDNLVEFSSRLNSYLDRVDEYSYKEIHLYLKED